MAAPSDHRRLTERRIVLATHNAGKAREIGDLMRPFGTEVVTAGELGLAEPEEIGATFAENAALKARAAAEAARLPALADDSGLCVVVLDGAPGLHSARWAGEERDFAHAMGLVEELLKALGTNDRRAHFICALALAWPDGTLEAFEGRVDGTLVWPPRGAKGFGYDPMFVPDGYSQTFGEMDPDVKHAISHRARAFAALVDACLARS
jgi:XTP/dITP diphosphohydrolase